ncbi:MAG: hypothetical protein D3926_14835 [Desulfobacteraceae bacterium]|nr:MAG: hypothetical protein D3926_14835 [Desulfobacteraceae bacterium]
MKHFIRFFVMLCVAASVLMLCVIPAQGQNQIPSGGRILKIQGQVDVKAQNIPDWKSATPGMDIRPGDMLRTGHDGWAALIMADESMIHIGKNTRLIIKQVDPSAAWLIPASGNGNTPEAESIYILDKGRLWLRNKNRNQNIDIHTPYVSTSIRGTELDIDIRPENQTLISVLEGRVLAKNNQGSMIINALEQVVAAPGLPLSKTILIRPEHAVQWTISAVPVVDTLLEDTAMARELGHAASLIDERQYLTALEQLGKIESGHPEKPLALCLSGLIRLIVNDSGRAMQDIQSALEMDPDNPAAHLIHAYLLQGRLKLDAAMASTQTALSLNPGYTAAQLNLARLYFAIDETERSRSQVDFILEQHPGHAEALTLKGFLLLATLNTDASVPMFERAVRSNHLSGEPHLGLALAFMRQGNVQKAFEQITTAVLLEPQRSLFLSYWAKMLYESKRFEQALDILELAARLDTNDPTPHLYRSHIFRDLNRHHESIHAMETAVSLNDNRAVYRSRMLMDRDLAVKNVNLALTYKQLGVSEWGQLKAMASLKQDTTNFAAHNFLAGQLEYLQGYNSYPARSARLRAFLMQPANLNTLNTFNDYTSFLEKPDIGGTLAAYAGNNGYLDKELEIHGALPHLNTSYSFKIETFDYDGWQAHDREESTLFESSFKWDISHRDTLSLNMHYLDTDTGDLSSRTSWDAVPDPGKTGGSRFADVGLGYMRHLSAASDLFFHIKREFKHKKRVENHLSGIGTAAVFPYVFDVVYSYDRDEWLEDPYTAIQAMQVSTLGRHQVSWGGFIYESDRDYQLEEGARMDFYWDLEPIPAYAFTEYNYNLIQSSRVKNHHSVYVQDTWNPSDSLTVEAALYVDEIRNVNSLENLKWSDTYINPRFGLIYRPDPVQTVRLSWFRYLEPFESVERIDAIDVAGHLLPTFFEGAVIEEAALSYEVEWGTGMFWGRCFLNTPEYEYKTLETPGGVMKRWENRYKGLEFALNQLLLDDMGLAAGFAMLEIDRDQVTPQVEGKNQWAWARLTKGMASGLTISAGISHYDTDYDAPAMADEDFWIAASFIEYELPGKVGTLRFEVNNLFNTHFNGTPLSDAAGIIPERFYMLMARFNF